MAKSWRRAIVLDTINQSLFAGGARDGSLDLAVEGALQAIDMGGKADEDAR